MGKDIPPFTFSAGERKIMAHFVVKSNFLISHDNIYYRCSVSQRYMARGVDRQVE